MLAFHPFPEKESQVKVGMDRGRIDVGGMGAGEARTRFSLFSHPSCVWFSVGCCCLTRLRCVLLDLGGSTL